MKKNLSLILLTAVLAFYATPATAEDNQSEHAKKVMAHNHKGQSEFTLIQVMHDLAYQLSRIQFGLLTSNRLMIKEGAKGIANHPAPKGGIKPYIKRNAEAIKEVIPEMDKIVHQTSIKIAKIAETADMLELQKLETEILSGCIGCHDMFRD